MNQARALRGAFVVLVVAAAVLLAGGLAVGIVAGPGGRGLAYGLAIAGAAAVVAAIVVGSLMRSASSCPACGKLVRGGVSHCPRCRGSS